MVEWKAPDVRHKNLRAHNFATGKLADLADIRGKENSHEETKEEIISEEVDVYLKAQKASEKVSQII